MALNSFFWPPPFKHISLLIWNYYCKFHHSSPVFTAIWDCTFPCSLHILHHWRGAKCAMNMEMYNPCFHLYITVKPVKRQQQYEFWGNFRNSTNQLKIKTFHINFIKATWYGVFAVYGDELRNFTTFSTNVFIGHLLMGNLWLNTAEQILPFWESSLETFSYLIYSTVNYKNHFSTGNTFWIL